MSNNFLQQLQRRRQMHLKQAASHVDKPSEQTLEGLEAETKRLQHEAAKAEVHYWEEKRQANAGGDEPVFGLASNQKRRFVLPKGSRRRSWK